MGWTTNDLHRNRTTLEQAKAAHLRDATDYTTGTAELLAHEWHRETFYAIIRRTFPPEMNRAPVTFLRVDIIEQSPASFGYKDMSESMGPYVQDAPSATMRAAIYKHIPIAEGYAREFRDRMGIKYSNQEQGEMFATAKARGQA